MRIFICVKNLEILDFLFIIAVSFFIKCIPAKNEYGKIINASG